MIKRNLWVLLVLVFWQTGYTQEVKFKFLGELHDDHARLAWIPESWSEAISGVMIKRQEDDGKWSAVTETAVIPSSAIDKDLSNVEPLASERLRLKNKFDDIIASGRGKPVSAEEYRDKLTGSASSGASIAMIFAMDYDLMLLNGFGLIDRQEDISGPQTYGLFPVIDGQISNEPINTITLSLEKDSKLTMTGNTRVIGKNKQLRLMWEFDLMTYKSLNYKGFDILASFEGEPVRLNRNTIWITSKEEPGILTYVVDFPDSSLTYSAVPFSYFNTPGEAHHMEFNPLLYTTPIPSPVLDGRTDGSMVQLTWTLDHVYDSLLKTIEVYHRQGGNDKMIAELSVDQRNFIIDSRQPGTSRYRLTVKTKSGERLNSNDKLLHYEPTAVLPKPLDLKGKVVLDSTGNFVELSWSYPQNTPGISFRIFTAGPGGELIYNSALSRDVTSPKRIPVRSFRSTHEVYAIQAMDEQRNKSALSNHIELTTPSERLPEPRLNKVEARQVGNVLLWDYSDNYLDLQGFRVFVNGLEVMNENNIGAALREVSLPELEPGIHEVALQAISIYGIKSDQTGPFRFKVE